MSRPLARTALLVLAVAVVALVASGCGASNDLDVKEGEPVKLGDLSYNVQLTRFLNDKDAEDRGYLVGQKPAQPDEKYFGVFVRIANVGSSPAQVASSFKIEDTQHASYEALPSKSPYALDLGGTIAPDSVLPSPGTTAADGPTQGAMILFLIRGESTENRPLDLVIPGDGETARIELDI